MKSRAIVFLSLVLFLSETQCGSGVNDYAQLTLKTNTIMESDTIINRRPAVAGTFYAEDREELNQQLNALFSKATPNRKFENIVALITPHAGYIYSGIVAASAFNQLSPDVNYENVFLIGSSHHTSFDGGAIYSIGNFITPLGIARVNMPLAKKLISDNPEVFRSVNEAHISEHSLEVQLPFLQYIYKDKLQIVPIILGTQRRGTTEKIAAALSPYFNEKNLFIISTDFSHYPDYQSAIDIDKSTADAIVKNNSTEFLQVLQQNDSKNVRNMATSICGWTSVLTFLHITETTPGIQYHQIRYMNSGDVQYGDKNRVVGYHALAVTLHRDKTKQSTLEDYSLTTQEKEKLLRIARVSIEEYLETGKMMEVKTTGLPDKLLAPSGAFVTLHKEGNLRGCIGRFNADLPLYKVVQEMAISAALHDYRFTPLTKEELNMVDVEISVLTPMRKIQSPDEIVLGKHGIYIKKGSHSGTFLPQVATQTKWTLEEFLGHCARDKAGIGWDDWKDAEVFVYEAYVFGEK